MGMSLRNPRTGEEITVQPSQLVEITPGSGTISGSPVSLYVGTGGDVEVVDTKGTTTVFANVPSGTFMPILVNKVLSGNTTASDIVAIY
jgi:hypothetical protein